MQVLEPTEVKEITRGRYDGDFRVIGNAPCCGGRVGHLMGPDYYGGGKGAHRVCNAQCRDDKGAGRYVLVRPMRDLLNGDRHWWKNSTDGLSGTGLGADSGPSLMDRRGDS